MIIDGLSNRYVFVETGFNRGTDCYEASDMFSAGLMLDLLRRSHVLGENVYGLRTKW